MKRILPVLICLTLAFHMCTRGGDTTNVKTHEVASEVYTQEDIASAIETITEEFNNKWNGCTLTEIYYAGDDTSRGHQDWADRNNADEVMVLLSSFDVDSSGKDGLEPNSTYDGWNWILVRTEGGDWQHVDHGY